MVDRGERTWHSSEERFVRGQARYVADIQPEGCLHAAFVRSWLPHGVIESIDVSHVLGVSGVVGAWSGSDLAELCRPISVDGEGLASIPWSPIAVDRVRYAGEPVAVVVAESPHVAEDGASSVIQDITPLTPVASVDESLEDDCPRLYPELASNVIYEMQQQVGEPDKALSESNVVVRKTFRFARQSPFPLEARGVLALIEGDDLIVWSSTQIPHIVRALVTRSLSSLQRNLEVVTPDVGGGFGLKLQVFGEEVVIPALADLLERPVKWIEDRRENLSASAHAHNQVVELVVGSDRDGTLRAVHVGVTVDVGAYSVYPLTASLDVSTTIARVLAPYNVSNFEVRGRAVVTNKAPVGAYRGVGFSAGVFSSERMVDVLAQSLGIDRVELRLKNLIRPDQMPYESPLGSVFDTGDYPRALELAAKEAGYEELLEEQRKARENGEYLGIGAIIFNEHTGIGSAAYQKRGVFAVPGFDSAIACLEGDGRLSLLVSSAEAGQRHAEAYRLIATERLGIDPELIDIIEGNTSLGPEGTGTFASRAAGSHMACVALAVDRLAEKAVGVAARALSVEPEHLSVKGGRITDVRSGTVLSLEQLAEVARGEMVVGERLPQDIAGRRVVLAAKADWDPQPTFAYGAHVCMVRVDPRTFRVEILKYVSIEDCGRIISRAGVEDQVLGGVAMGIGNALLEEHVYSEEADLLTASMLDYLVPLATDMPRDVRFINLESPTEVSLLGAKGVAEAGTIGSIAVVGCAVADAVDSMGGDITRIPASPHHIFAALTSVGDTRA